jgi:hypothetical protein
VPEFLPALDRTLELEADVSSTNSPPPKAIGPRKDLEEAREPILGVERSRVRPCTVVEAEKVEPPPSATLESFPATVDPRVSIPDAPASV